MKPLPKVYSFTGYGQGIFIELNNNQSYLLQNNYPKEFLSAITESINSFQTSQLRNTNEGNNFGVH